MTARVRALGYLAITATDLDEWVSFGSELLGLQVAYRDDDRLLLRMDDREYRLDIRRGDEGGVTALGWDVGGPQQLAELTGTLKARGYTVEPGGEQLIAERRVMGLTRLRGPEGDFEHELFWGARSAQAAFISPTGARFVTGDLGLGHVFQALHHGAAAYDELFQEVLGFRLSDHIDMPGDVGTFLHCNARHHSFAYANAPHRKPGIGHMMVEIDDLDVLGRAWDKVQEQGLTILSTLGRHTNDEMLSFYVRTPSGFGLEYGLGGLHIDDDTWVPVRYDSAHYWGHQRPQTT